MSNTITITGRIARDPELRFSNTGLAVCSISVPDQKRRKNDAGEWEDASATTWFKATVFKDAAEALAEQARKGDQVTVTGRLVTREYTTKDGEQRSSLEVDFATVAVVPRSQVATRQQPASSGPPADDPWSPKQSSSYDEPPW